MACWTCRHNWTFIALWNHPVPLSKWITVQSYACLFLLKVPLSSVIAFEQPILSFSLLVQAAVLKRHATGPGGGGTGGFGTGRWFPLQKLPAAHGPFGPADASLSRERGWGGCCWRAQDPVYHCCCIPLLQPSHPIPLSAPSFSSFHLLPPSCLPWQDLSVHWCRWKDSSVPTSPWTACHTQCATRACFMLLFFWQLPQVECSLHWQPGKTGLECESQTG